MPADLRIAGPDKAQTPDEKPFERLVPGQLGQDALDSVGEIHSSWLKSLEAGLAELLQTSVPMSPGKTAQAPLPEAFSDIGPEDHVIALELGQVGGRGFLTFPPTLLFRVLDILLATPEPAPGELPPDESQRTITGIELYILREFFDVFTRSLRAAWEPFYPVAFTQISGDEESGPRAAAYGDDPALILCANIDLAGASADVRLVLPAFLARLVQLKSKAAVDRPNEPVPVSILNCLGDATLRMEAVLDGASIRIRNLLDMAPGNILMLGTTEETSFDCLVNGRRRFTGELVASNGRCAIQVDRLAGELATDK